MNEWADDDKWRNKSSKGVNCNYNTVNSDNLNVYLG